MPGLGRIHAPDERDHRFLLPTRRLEAKGIVRRSWVAGPILDQGNTPQCVGYSTWGFLAASPIRNKPKFSPTDLYREAQQLDEWPGQEPDYEGSSVRGAMKALQKRELVSTYSWAFNCEAVIDHVLAVGPVVMGTDWHDRMFEPTAYGYLIPDGQVVGGHAWLIIGADRERNNRDGTVGAIRMINSWGRGWGENGRARMSFANLDRLIKANGEAAVANEVLGVIGDWP